MDTFPHDRPFLAADTGLHRRTLARLVAAGDLRRLLRGVYVDAVLPDTLHLRASALGLVVPSRAVVTDRAAAWLHGLDLLLPDELDLVPPVTIFHTGRGRRLTHPTCDSGQRIMPPMDREVIHGVSATTPLRTALDMGRLAHRDRAFAALDAFLRLGVDHERLLGQIERFKGYRGVRQLRNLAPLANPLAESPAESVTRLRWLDSATPWPDLQIEVEGEHGALWRLDLGIKELFFAVEYDGEEFHSTPEQLERDHLRRTWMMQHTPWHIEVLRKNNVYGRQRDFEVKLPAMIRDARRTLGERLTRGCWSRWD